jgi:hypothetical protein
MTDEEIRVRDGRLLAAAQGIDLELGSCDESTREYWYVRGDEARAALAGFEAKRFRVPYLDRWVTG